MGGDALPVLPPLEVLTARRRLRSLLPFVARAAMGVGATGRSGSALRFKGLTEADPPLLVPAGRVEFERVETALLALARPSWEMSGEDDDELEDWFWLSERPKLGASEALAGGEDRGEGFWGEVEGRAEGGRLAAVLVGSSLGVGTSALGTLGVGAAGVSSFGRGLVETCVDFFTGAVFFVVVVTVVDLACFGRSVGVGAGGGDGARAGAGGGEASGISSSDSSES